MHPNSRSFNLLQTWGLKMLNRFYVWVRTLPWWGQLFGLPAYGLARLVVAIVNGLGHLIVGAVVSFFGQVVKGSFKAVLVKIAALLLFLGFVAVGVGVEDAGGVLMTLAVFPIMGLGFAMIVTAPFVSVKKKKNK